MNRTAVLAAAVVLLIAAAPTQQTPEAVVDAFHAAIVAGDGDAALALLDEGVVIFESGGAEMSRQEYASHHLDADMRFSRQMERKVTARQSGSAGDVAWVLSRTETHGTYAQREIHARGTETMLLRLGDSGWRIVHIHWSSGRIRGQ